MWHAAASLDKRTKGETGSDRMGGSRDLARRKAEQRQGQTLDKRRLTDIGKPRRGAVLKAYRQVDDRACQGGYHGRTVTARLDETCNRRWGRGDQPAAAGFEEHLVVGDQPGQRLAKDFERKLRFPRAGRPADQNAAISDDDHRCVMVGRHGFSRRPAA